LETSNPNAEQEASVAKTKYPYRVFLSYSHDNENEACQVRARLKSLGMEPMSDHLLAPGTAFSDEIKRYISYAHLFIPLVTQSSSTRPWVHQEVGFALAMGVPILPLAIESVPEGFVHQIQSIVVKKGLSDLNEKLVALVFDVAFAHTARAASATVACPNASVPTYQCAQSLRQRTQTLVDASRDIRLLGNTGSVRIKAAFGPFTLPNASPDMPIWDERERKNNRDLEVRELLRQEREEIELHAKASGCRMILAADPLKAKGHTPKSTAKRLRILCDFLTDARDGEVDVVFIPCAKMDSNLLIVGDWFVSEAIVPKHGDAYRLTTFTRHGSTVLRAAADYDRQFNGLLVAMGGQPGKTRGSAIKEVEKLIRQLESQS
jgi:hypothetical protein